MDQCSEERTCLTWSNLPTYDSAQPGPTTSVPPHSNHISQNNSAEETEGT
jgi:hypothetical protein